MLHLRAMFSVPRPMLMYVSGEWSTSQGLGEILLPPIGTRDMDSVPPATITCAEPPRMRSAASAMACNPDEQKRLMVIAEVSTGRPARSAAMRATFIPCSPSGMAQPRITSSISLGSSPGTRASASLMASAARSSGRVARNEPLEARPTGVRTEETITASGMAEPHTAKTEIGNSKMENRLMQQPLYGFIVERASRKCNQGGSAENEKRKVES